MCYKSGTTPLEKESYIPTIGLEVVMYEIPSKNLKFQLWDTAGQRRFQTGFIYCKANIVIICYDATAEIFNPDELENFFDPIKQTCSRTRIIIAATGEANKRNENTMQKAHVFISENFPTHTEIRHLVVDSLCDDELRAFDEYLLTTATELFTNTVSVQSEQPSTISYNESKIIAWQVFCSSKRVEKTKDSSSFNELEEMLREYAGLNNSSSTTEFSNILQHPKRHHRSFIIDQVLPQLSNITLESEDLGSQLHAAIRILLAQCEHFFRSAKRLKTQGDFVSLIKAAIDMLPDKEGKQQLELQLKKLLTSPPPPLQPSICRIT